MRGEDAPNLPTLPLQKRVTLQILNHFQPFKDLKETFAVSRRAEQLCLRTKQRIVATVEDSVLRTEMENLESQEEDAPKRVLAEMRPGLLVSGRPFLPLVSVQKYRPWRSCHSRLVVAKKFTIDALGEYVSTCTAHSGAKKAHDWALEQLAD